MRITGIVAALLLGACATRIIGGVDDVDAGDSPWARDLSVPPDLAVPPDLRPPADLKRKSCGEIMTCMFRCGVSIGTCQLQCFQGASPEGQQQAGTLLACVVRNCLLGGADGGGAAALPICVFNKCQKELGACEGFSF